VAEENKIETHDSSCGLGIRMLTGASCVPRAQEKPFMAGSLALGVMYRLGAVLVDVACDHLKSAATERLQELQHASRARQGATAAGAGRPQGTDSLQTKEIVR
jgi:hypothetical protein